MSARQDALPVLDALLSEGHGMHVPVRGRSMRPALVDGDVAVVAPFLGLPRPGNQQRDVGREETVGIDDEVRPLPRVQPPGDEEVLEGTGVEEVRVGQGGMQDAEGQPEGVPETMRHLFADREPAARRDRGERFEIHFPDSVALSPALG